MRLWWRRLMSRIAPMQPGDQSRLDKMDARDSTARRA